MACLDARMQEVYWGAFEVRDGEIVSLTEEALSPSEAVRPPVGSWFGAGSGWAAYGGRLTKGWVESLMGVDSGLLPMAGDIARLGEKAFQQGKAVAPERALPVYLRDKVATPKP